jgi:phage terminase large subunit-like protein
MIDEHERRDRSPYRAWVQQGYIDAPPGRAIDYGYIAQKLAGINTEFDVLGMAYDRWRIEVLLKELSAIGVDCFVDGKEEARPGALRLVPWGQGYKDLSPAVDALETSVINGQLKHNGNPVLTWCMSNAMAITDPAGNRKLDKSKSRFRIDGAVALAMAVGLKARDIEKVSEESFTEKHGVVIL